MNSKILISILILITINCFSQDRFNKQNMAEQFDATMISVTVGGSFPVTGSFPAYFNERVDEFITRMYKEASQQVLTSTGIDLDVYRKALEDLNDYSLRGIKLIRQNGEEIPIDLQRFRLTGDFQYNPYLKNDDVIVFPPNDLSRNFISVAGAVNRSGVFYFVEGDKLSDALELAGGLNPAYEKPDSVEISRLSYDGENQVLQMAGINDFVLLKRGDRIRVIVRESQRLNFGVLVLGEVESPGYIPITKNTTTLYDVINLAGGFTKNASLRRSRVYSKKSLAILLERQYDISLASQPDLENPKYRNLILNLEGSLMLRMSHIYPEDTTYFNIENTLRLLTGGSSLDFEKINDPNSNISNYIVESGDVIVIPAIQYSVYVFGQVARPGNVSFVVGKDYQYYIEQAGGLGELAIEDDIMLIKGGSRTWISPVREKVTIEEGDYIFIPKENLRSFRSYIVEYSVYVSLLASISAILLSIITIANN